MQESLGDLARVTAPEDKPGVVLVVKDYTPSIPRGIYKDYYSHPVQLHHLTWQPTDGFGMKYSMFDIVDNYFSLLPSALQGKWDGVRYFTGDLKIRVVVQGLSYCYGKMICSYDPSPEHVEGRQRLNPTYGVCGATMKPHIAISASDSTAYELTLPCVTPLGVWGRLNQPPSIGSYDMRMHVLTPLGSGTASPPVDVLICCYMYFENVEMVGFTTTSSLAVSEEVKPAKLSQIAQTVSQAASMVSSIPVIGGAASLVSEISGKAASILQMFGYSRPTLVDRTPVVQNMFTNDYAHFNGNSYDQILTSDIGNSLSVDPSTYPLGDLTEMSIEKVCNKYALLDTTFFDPTLPANTELLRFGVHPAVTFYSAGGMYDVVTSPFMEYPPCSHVAKMFAFWRGTMRYRFEFVCSPFHRATVVILYNTSNNLWASSVNDISTLKSHVVQITGPTEVIFECEWNQPDTYLRSALYDQGSLSSALQGFANGQVAVKVINPVTANGSSDPIYMNTYVSAKDVSFAMPTLVDYDNFTLVPGTTSSPNMLTMGERIDSMKQLAMKPSTYRSYKVNASSYNAITDTFWPYCPGQQVAWGSAGWTFGTYHTYFAIVAQGYVGFRGSRRVSTLPVHTMVPAYEFNYITNAGDGATVREAALTPTDYVVASRHGSMALQTVSKHPTLDVTLPQYYPWNFFPSLGWSAEYNQPTSYAWTFSRQQDNVDEVTYVLLSAGDDTSFMMYRGFPALTNPDYVP